MKTICYGFLKYPRQESNLYLKFRKLLFYPLNYGAMSLEIIQTNLTINLNPIDTMIHMLTEKKQKNFL